MSHFALHPQLAADTTLVTHLALCQVLLMNDARYPWLILVPQQPDLTDMHQLNPTARYQLSDEIQQCSEGLTQVVKPHKLNVAALGNMVPQLHVHVIARNPDDAAWPGPVWGVGKATPYAPTAHQTLLDSLRASI